MGAFEAARENSIGAWRAIIDYSDQHTEPYKASEQREITKLGEQALAAEKRFRTLQAEGGWSLVVPDIDDAAADIVGSARKMVDQLSGRGQPRVGMGGSGLPFPGGRGGRRGGGPVAALTDAGWGQSVLDSLDARGGMSMQASVLTGGSTPVAVPLNPIPVMFPQRPRFLRELIPTEAAPAGRFSFVQQTVRTSNATAVARGALKPTSIYTTQVVSDRTRTIATLSEPIARQDLNDAALIRAFVDSELAYSLDLELDRQILAGDGSGENMTGILTTSGIQTQAFVTDALLTTRKALTKLQSADIDGDCYVMNPASWEKIELLAEAQFAANPGQATPSSLMERRLWGIPVLVSNGVPANVGVLGSFRGSSVLYMTQEATIDWSENTYDPNALGTGVGATDFSRNMIRFRAELRACIAITRAFGFVSIALA